ncbi:MAG: hypothetical protein SFW36_00710 [Leptolyngbyaceae cyanobacterium bins.59]|nr:hypothetical protein [Leptolyngbyaceae cyanobacterium bins.59]
MSKSGTLFFSEKNLMILVILVLLSEFVWLISIGKIHQAKQQQETIELVRQSLGKAERLRLQNGSPP